MKEHKTIFNPDFLKQELDKFSLNSFPDIHEIKSNIEKWIKRIETGIVRTTKEEAQDSLFAECIFDNALGYKRWTTDERNLNLQEKSQTDGTKCDFALGYFTDKETRVKVIVEVKDSSHKDLDEAQKRANDKRTPVEQAFEYAHKQGENCKWVIVSNFIEIRFYLANDSTKYEKFILTELRRNQYEFKKFLFLLHKDRLISKEVYSLTDRFYEANKSYDNSQRIYPKHIIDEIYTCLKKFDGFGFVSVNILSNCKPFNINPKNRLWNVNTFTLITNNEKAYEFFQNILIQEQNIILNAEHDLFVQDNLIIYQEKIEFIIQRLNHFLISNIAFEKKEGISIEWNNHETCDCLQCNYESLDFGKVIKKLKNLQGNPLNNNLENAYAFYKIPIDNYKPAYQMYKAIQKSSKEQGKDIEYFVATYNLKQLGNIMWYDYDFEDKATVIQELENIDLQKEIHYTLDITTDIDVREALLELAENKVFARIEYKVDKALKNIKKVRKLYEKGGTQYGSGDLPVLWQQQIYLYYYTRRNFIIFDRYTDYQQIQQKIFEIFVISYSISDKYINKLKEFNYFILINTILYLSNEDLKSILLENSIKILETDEEAYTKLLSYSYNILTSVVQENSFGNQPNKNTISLFNNRDFENEFGRIFNNLFLILSVMNIKKEGFHNTEKLICDFIKFYDCIAWNNLNGLGLFIYEKGSLFSIETLSQLLQIIIDRHSPHSHQYTDLIEKICYSISKHFPSFKVSDSRFVNKLLVNFISEKHESGHRDLIPFWHILSTECQSKLLEEFTSYLDKKFNSDIYYELFRQNIIDYNYKDYFEKYKNKVINGLPYYTSGQSKKDSLGARDYSHSFIFLCQIIYMKNLFKEKIFDQVTDLRDFEIWLINPYEFDYSKFEVEWIERVAWYTFTDILKNIIPLKEKIYLYLKNNPSDSKISKIYFEHFT